MWSLTWVGIKVTGTSAIHSRSGCNIHVFEPLAAFAEQLKQRFAEIDNIQVHHCGLAASDQIAKLGVAAESSSAFRSADQTESCSLQSIDRFLRDSSIAEVALMKVNIEGGEYELFEHLVTTGLISKFKELLVQFHWFVPDARRRMQAIQKKLSQTHQLSYQYPFVWENWTRRDS